MPKPCIVLPTKSRGMLAASAARTQPTVTTTSPPTIVCFRYRPSPRRPMIGELTAPASKAAVSDHWAVLTDS